MAPRSHAHHHGPPLTPFIIIVIHGNDSLRPSFTFGVVPPFGRRGGAPGHTSLSRASFCGVPSMVGNGREMEGKWNAREGVTRGVMLVTSASKVKVGSNVVDLGRGHGRHSARCLGRGPMVVGARVVVPAAGTNHLATSTDTGDGFDRWSRRSHSSQRRRRPMWFLATVPWISTPRWTRIPFAIRGGGRDPGRDRHLNSQDTPGKKPNHRESRRCQHPPVLRRPTVVRPVLLARPGTVPPRRGLPVP